jgi:hypothetical protein
MTALVSSPSKCAICLEDNAKSFSFHEALSAELSHRMHDVCIIGWFKACLDQGIEINCPICRSTVEKRWIMDFAKHILTNGRATDQTPGAIERDCPLLSPGFVSDKDFNFANQIFSQAGRAHTIAKKLLVEAIIAYTK